MQHTRVKAASNMMKNLHVALQIIPQWVLKESGTGE